MCMGQASLAGGVTAAPLRSSFLACVHLQAPLNCVCSYALGRIERLIGVRRQCWLVKVFVSVWQDLQLRYGLKHVVHQLLVARP